MERYVIVIPADEEQKARLVRCDDGDTCKLETLQEPVCCWQRPGWICGSRDERRENVDENKEKSPPEAGTESSAYEWRARQDIYCNIPRLPEARSAAN